jgi:hypothetical protein
VDSASGEALRIVAEPNTGRRTPDEVRTLRYHHRGRDAMVAGVPAKVIRRTGFDASPS